MVEFPSSLAVLLSRADTKLAIVDTVNNKWKTLWTTLPVFLPVLVALRLLFPQSPQAVLLFLLPLE